MTGRGTPTIKRLCCVAALGAVIVAGTIIPAPAGAAPKPHGPVLSSRLSRLAGLSMPDALAAAAADGVPTSGVGSLEQINDRLVVDIWVSAESSEIQSALVAAGASIVHIGRAQPVIAASVNPSQLPEIAAVPGVVHVGEDLAPAIADAVAGSAAAAAATSCHNGAGSVVSKGDGVLQADTLRSLAALTGAGVPIGVVSNSYDTNTTAPTHAAQDIATGDLPGPGNPCGQTSPVSVLQDWSGANNTDEGRAMLQIIHDTAPSSPLLFATGEPDDTAFADNIAALVQAGAKVIVDDMFYTTEPIYQAGPIAAAISAARAAGVVYLSASGNQNVIVGGNDVGSIESPALRPTPCPAVIAAQGVSCHNWATSGTADATAGFTVPAGLGINVNLEWAEPLNDVPDNLDLYLLDHKTGAILASSTAVQSGSEGDDPVENLSWPTTTPTTKATAVDVAVRRTSGSGTPRLKITLIQDGSKISAAEHTSSGGGDIVGPTLFGHMESADDISVAAVPAGTPTQVEPFSSAGPATLYFEPADGSSVAAPLSTPTSVAGPALTGVDNVATTFFGPKDKFSGTSAAAPGDAAVAALLLQAAPDATPAQIEIALGSGAANVGPASVAGGGLDQPTAIEATLPANTGPGTVALDGISCPGSGFCAAVGSLQPIAQTRQGLIETTGGTTWQGITAPLPSDGNSHFDAQLLSVSCPVAGWCAAVGYYATDTGEQALLETLSNGVWTPAAPSIAATGVTELTSVSCGGVGSCVAVGNYEAADGNAAPLIVQLTGGVWTIPSLPLPAGAAAGQAADLEQVSCASVDTCVVVGLYSGPHNTIFGLAESFSDGSWTAQKIKQPADAATSFAFEASLIDCPTPTSCTFVASYTTTTGQTSAVIETLAKGKWSPTTPTAPASSTDPLALDSISCVTSTSCVAVGQAGSIGAIVRLAAGEWTTSTAPVPGDATGNVTLSEVACSNADTCFAVGVYTDTQRITGAALIEEITTDSVTASFAPTPTNASPNRFATLGAVSCVPSADCAAAGEYYDNSLDQQGLIES